MDVFGSWVLSSSKCTFAVQLNKIDEYIGVGVVDQQYKHREIITVEDHSNWICYCSSGNIINKQSISEHAVS